MKVAITIAVILLGIAAHILGIPFLVNATSSNALAQLNGGNTAATVAGSVSSAGLWFNMCLALVVAAIVYFIWKKKE